VTFSRGHIGVNEVDSLAEKGAELAAPLPRVYQLRPLDPHSLSFGLRWRVEETLACSATIQRLHQVPSECCLVWEEGVGLPAVVCPVVVDPALR